MKTLTHFALALLLACCAFTAAAQCSVDGKWGYTINPNRVHVFTDSSTVAPGYQISTHYWTFGDGSTSQLANPTHQYINPGYYNVCEYIIATQIGGTGTCRDTVCRTVSNCDGMVQASFTVNVQGSTVIYTGTGTSNYPPLRYSWSLPGALPSAATTATVTASYNAPGVHNACLTVTDTNGCYATVCQSVTTTTPCGNLVANFNASINNGFVYLSSTSTGTTTNTLYQWWRDGQAITNPTPNTASYQYAPAGVHTYCLYVYSAQNSFCDSACRSYTVDTCIADFQTSINNNVVTFRPQLSGPAADSYWNFGDGIGLVDTSASLTHTYPATPNATTYTVCHVWSKSNCGDTVCKQIVIPGTSPCGSIVPNFTATQYNNKVILTSTSTGTNNNTLYQWFQDFAGITAATPNTGYTATGVSTGAHTFCLAVFANANTYCDSICKGITLVNCAGTAGFQTTVQGNVATFYPANTGGAQNDWNFGDGSNTTSNGSSQFTHTYPSSPNTQVYTVLHIRLDGPCGDTVRQQITIPGTTACGTASFTSSQASGHLVLTSTSTGTNTNVVWAIRNLNGVGVLTGSGSPFTAATLPNGTYQVCLYLYNANQQLCDTTCQTIAVTNSNPCNGLTAQWTQLYNRNDSVAFKASNTLSGVTYNWSFGDGQSASTADPIHRYTSPGSYTVCLVVSIPGTICRDTLCQTVQIACHGAVAITATNNGNGSKTLSAAATGLGTSLAYAWSIGATTQTITVTAPGQYCVTAVSTNSNCSATACYTFATSTCDTAAFTTAITGNTVVLTSTSSGTNTRLWTIRNSNNGAEQTGTGTPFTAILAAGNYQVCLSTYNNNQQLCDSNCQNITITSINRCDSLTAQWSVIYNQNDTVKFRSYNPLSGVAYHWTFGDGSAAINVHPTHRYNAPGTYTVCLIVNLTGTTCADTLCQTIQVGCSGAATISAVNNGNGSKTLTAAATGLGTPLTYTWNNGANTQVITVTAPGQYCVTITGNSNCSATACYTFTSTTCGTASFTATQSSGRVVLTSTSTGTNNQYVWAIRTQNGAGVATGSGSPFTSPALANGVYQVCLYLYNSNQTLCDTTCQYVTVTTSNPCLGVSAQWTKTYNTNNSISFSATNQASGNQYLWTFGDGSSATTADPVHGYATAGLYNVCLVVWRSGTNCSDTVCQNLQANPATTTCTSVASVATTVANGSIYATSTSTNVSSATRYAWSLYGSNNTLIQTQTGTNSSFQSQALPNGNYTVCLLLFSNNTQTLCDSACVTVSVTNGNACSALNANYTYSYQTNGGVHFYPVTNPGTATHYWNFGDGSTSTNADPVHYYSTAGLYTICHAVEIPGANCMDTTCTTIQVTAGNPCNGFTVNVNTTSGWFTTRHLEAVTAGGTAPFTYAWSNGATTASIYPTVTGTYCVTVYDARQCSATDCETFTVTTPACNASYSYTRTNCNTVQFNNASTGGYTNVVWNFGDGSSSSALNPIHTFPVGTWTVQLTVYSTGTNCQASYYQVITIQPCGINDTICGVVFNDINGNGVQETNEPGIGGGIIYAGNYHETVSSNGHYTLILPSGNYTLYYCAPAGYSFTIPVGTQTPNSSTNTCAYYTITTTGGSHCGYNFGVQNNSSTVCGLVYFDANNNQVQDAGEAGTANAHIFATLSNGTVVHAYTDQTGRYCITLAPGTYTLTVSTGLGATATPQAITLTTVAGTNYNNNNFGIYTQPGSCNLRLDIVPHTTITAGFAAWYDLVVTNLGASTSNGTVSMFFDPAITFTSASPAQTTVNNSTQTVTWDFTGLTPGSTRHFWANFRALTNIQINQPVFTLANVVTNNCNEVDFTDNVDTVHQNVTASWDPNNKLVVPDGIIKGDERLTYTVNFQNTGNAPAVNVVVRDMIAPELDIETFRMVDASHAYTVQFAGREVIWKFNAIMLPDSNSNEPQSHGHVTFSILPVANQNKGTQITNKADIYFDYNAPVLTNSTLNTIDYELSVNDLENGKVAITLMPNPFKEFTTIKIDGENTAYELKMFDMLGQQVYQDRTSNNVFSIQRQTLAAGVYMYQISKQGKVIGQGKMIAE